MHKNHLGIEGDQLLGQFRKPPRIGVGKAILDADVAELRPSELLKPLPERRKPHLHLRIALRVVHQHADPSHTSALPRARRERPACCRAPRGA
jgi:hypothetical protein